MDDRPPSGSPTALGPRPPVEPFLLRLMLLPLPLLLVAGQLWLVFKLRGLI